jgi:hypothetical protein
MSGLASNENITAIKNIMQTEQKRKIGRPAGSRSMKTVRRDALRELESIMRDSSTPPETRAFAAAKLIDEAKA